MVKIKLILACSIAVYLYGCSLDDDEEFSVGSLDSMEETELYNDIMNEYINGPGDFDFTKISANGSDLSDEDEEWSCVRDNTTGLTWEVKSLSEGLHYVNNTYSWYNTNPSNNGGYSGVPNGGSCLESACDTQGFVDAVNQVGLCGYSDWRVPTRRELISIVDYSRLRPTIDKDFFPNSQSNYYWSSTPSSSADISDTTVMDNSFPWYVDFDLGYSGNIAISWPLSVRLVR